ncbi:MAG: TRAP transporter small permease [Planctomycetes bacterium]|nr:TRAP transporter small permease [Planctomycetota bacterium]
MKLLKFLDDKLEMTICIVLMSSMSVLLAVQVFFRYILKNSLSWSEELARYIFIWLIYLGISYGAKIMKHIRIDAALGLFPARLRPLVALIGDVIFLGFALYIAYSGWNMVQRQMRLGQTSPAMGIPMWLVYAAPMVGFGLTAIRQVQTIVYRVREYRRERGGPVHG